MKRLSAFYFILFFAYLLFLLFALLIMTGCGTDAPMETAAELSLPPAPLGSWEEPAGPSLALYVASAGGRLYYIPAPEELSARLEELAVNGPRLSGMTREWLEGWGDQLPAGVDELAVYYSAGASGFVPVYRNGAGEYGLAGAYADEEVRSLLRLVDHTGWDFAADLADFSGLRKLELMLDGQPLVTVTDAERLRAMEELLQSESRAVSPSKTPNEVIALRCTLADGSERTLVDDPDSHLAAITVITPMSPPAYSPCWTSWAWRPGRSRFWTVSTGMLWPPCMSGWPRRLAPAGGRKNCSSACLP